MKTFREIIHRHYQIYGVQDNRIYESQDFFYYHRKFLTQFAENYVLGQSMLKDLNIAFSWHLGLANKFSIDVEILTWRRYSYKCPFCLGIPCECLDSNGRMAQKTGRPASLRPVTTADWQKMLKKIYPGDEVADILSLLPKEHDSFHLSYRKFRKDLGKSKFREVESNYIDYFVRMIRLYNALEVDIAGQYQKLFADGCFVCHKTPCQCYYSE